MKNYLILSGLIIFMSSCHKKTLKRTRLEQRIDSIFEVYKKENYINESVLELYADTIINCNNLNSILQKIYFNDQNIRKTGDDMFALDSVNRIKVISIMKNCGDISHKKLDRKSYLTIFLVLQHSGDKDLMAYYYNDIKKFVDSNKLDKVEFALYIDRFLTHNDKKQIFGTQLNRFGKLFAIEDTTKVNDRRLKMGLKPLELNKQ